MNSRLQSFASGLRAEIPILIGVAPFGMIYGVLALKAGLPPLQAQLMSAVVFAGSSQFVLTQLIGAAAPALVMLLTVFVINLRHALYSASIAPYIRCLSTPWKLLLSYLLTDEAYAVGIIHYEAGRTAGPDCASSEGGPSAFSHYYFLGAGLALWSTWQLSTAAGIFLGAVVPAAWELDFSLALTFIALVIPNLRDRPAAAAAISAGVVSIAAYGLPYKLGLIAAALVGVITGLALERRSISNEVEQ